MDEFYVFVGAVLTFVLALVVSVTIYNIDVSNKKAAAIAAGNDPIAVMCAYENTSTVGYASVCNNTLKGSK